MMMDKTAIKVLIISSRADYGGGPEHIYKLISLLHEEVIFYVACPIDIPYWHRYSELLTVNNLFEIPHRKFSIKYLLALRTFTKNNKIDIIHSHGKGAGFIAGCYR